MKMKRVLILLLAVICLLPMGALGEEKAALFIAYDEATDKWGYIDVNGQWVISPQFDSADIFRGDYAAAYINSPDTAWGIIDREGNWVVPPEYYVDSGYDGWTYGGLDIGVYYLWKNNDIEGGMGFFDVRSGYFSGLVFQEELSFWGREDCPLVGVVLDGRPCYMDRTNGSVAFFLPDELSFGEYGQPSDFCDGFVCVFADDGDYIHPVILDEKGRTVDLGDWIISDLYTAFYGGVLPVMDPDTGLYGYFDLKAGKMLTPAQYTDADAFSSGYACVCLGENDWGHIDRQGNLVARGFPEPYTFFGDYAFLKDAHLLINAQGETVLSLPGMQVAVQWDDELREEYQYYVSPDGLMEILVEGKTSYCGIMNLQGEWVLPPQKGQYVYRGEETFSEEGWRFFSGGCQAIRRWESGKSGKIAYVNTEGEFITDFVYDDAGAFLNGLARVGKWYQGVGYGAYINTKGEEVFSWTWNDD